MKIVFLGDCHMGVRNGHPLFVEHFNSFFRDLLYPYMKKHGIVHIIQLGDLFDDRSKLNLKSFHESKKVWFDSLIENNFRMHTLIGNHDITMRESLSINSQTSLLQEYIQANVVKVYDKPSTIEFENCTIDMIPWICKENQEEVEKFIKKSKSDLCCGHFEINGAEMYRGVAGHGGLSPTIFDKYETTLSGHYHTRSFLPDHRINYVGTPYEITWMDAEDPRGFTVFDTIARTFEFVRNENVLYKKVWYKDTSAIDVSVLTNKIVRLYVESKKDLFAFDSFLNEVKNANPFDLSIIENSVDVTGVQIDDSIEVEDTLKIIDNYIAGTKTEVDKKELLSYIQELYAEAVNK